MAKNSKNKQGGQGGNFQDTLGTAQANEAQSNKASNQMNNKKGASNKKDGAQSSN